MQTLSFHTSLSAVYPSPVVQRSLSPKLPVPAAEAALPSAAVSAQQRQGGWFCNRRNVIAALIGLALGVAENRSSVYLKGLSEVALKADASVPSFILPKNIVCLSGGDTLKRMANKGPDGNPLLIIPTYDQKTSYFLAASLNKEPVISDLRRLCPTGTARINLEDTEYRPTAAPTFALWRLWFEPARVSDISVPLAPGTTVGGNSSHINGLKSKP
jgi:hypothetical protein